MGKIKHRIRKKYNSEWKGNENSVLAFLKVNNREGPVQLRMTSAQGSKPAAALHSSRQRFCDCVLPVLLDTSVAPFAGQT